MIDITVNINFRRLVRQPGSNSPYTTMKNRLDGRPDIPRREPWLSMTLHRITALRM